jgi:hypothetical protein
MSTENMTMAQLMKQQEAERKDLAAGAYEAWQPIGEKERQILSLCDGKFENASPAIQTRLTEMRKDYLREWGSDGELAVALHAKHAEERKLLAAQITQQLGQAKQKDRGRGR